MDKRSSKINFYQPPSNMLLQYYWIFYLDWILIDSIIIIILIFFLISVKIFKATHRWRNVLSNENLERFVFKKPLSEIKNTSVIVKSYSVIRNSSYLEKKPKTPIIVFIRISFKKKLTNILSEGLASYGFSVLRINLKIKRSDDHDVQDNRAPVEIQNIISAILNNLKKIEIITESNYITMNYSQSTFSYNSILADEKNSGLFLINPILNKTNFKDISQTLKDKHISEKFYIIFSKRSYLLFKNPNLVLFSNIFSNNVLNLITLEKATNAFKYYETILFGFLIKIIEELQLKS